MLLAMCILDSCCNQLFNFERNNQGQSINFWTIHSLFVINGFLYWKINIKLSIKGPFRLIIENIVSSQL